MCITGRRQRDSLERLQRSKQGLSRRKNIIFASSKAGLLLATYGMGCQRNSQKLQGVSDPPRHPKDIFYIINYKHHDSTTLRQVGDRHSRTFSHHFSRKDISVRGRQLFYEMGRSGTCKNNLSRKRSQIRFQKNSMQVRRSSINNHRQRDPVRRRQYEIFL